MPSIAIIPVGKDNSYNLPNKETLDKLSSVGAKYIEQMKMVVFLL